MLNMDTAANRLKIARLRKGIETAAEAARQIQMHPITYQAYENGARSFKRHVPRLACFYGVRPQWLERGLPPMLPSMLELKFNALSPEDRVKALEYIDVLATSRKP